MNRVELLSTVAALFSFKTVYDELGNEFVVFANSSVTSITGVIDKTAFEALENHVHLLDGVKDKEFDELIAVANTIGVTLRENLRHYFPNKEFVVYVSVDLHDSMIVRFHQKWPNELPYYAEDSFTSGTSRVLSFPT